MRRKSGGGADRPGRPVGQHIEDVAYNEALSERYLAYALSTITARSLPDVRDGLKPVHRRLIYAMLQLKLSPTEGFKKCARVVGDVIGKYHPHGDISVYEAMVRLAQHFSVRYRLVDGQGNFGSIDGDNAAAMRYTEARLTAYALALAEDLDMDTVDFVPNYDGSEHEPAVMPSAVPNLLANGSEGIAVGMATSVPPHNIGELCAAMTELLRDPQGTDIAAIMRHVKGPDFPTGGLLVEPEENIRKAYETGRGSFRLRARWHTEDAGRGQIRIVVTEIPFQVQKSRLIERIADLMKLKKITVLADVRDESAEDIRMVLEPKNRQIPPEAVMETLFKTTELETRFPLNMNVLDKDNVPRVMSLKEVMQCFLDHRRETLLRKTRWRTARIDERLEILEGLLIAYLNLDEVIRIIREEDEPKAVMMARWNLSERQTEAILNMRLRSLRKLEEIAITAERDALELERAGLAEILSSEARQTEVLLTGLEEIRRRFGEDNKEEGPRRSVLASAPENVPDLGAEAFVEKEPVTVFCSKQGWIRMFKGRDVDPAQVKYKDGDGERYAVPCFTTDKLLAFTCEGKCYTLQVHLLSGGKSAGEPLHVLFDMPEGTEVIALLPLKAGEKLLLVSADGRGFRLSADDAEAQTKAGKRLMNLEDNERMRWCLPVTGDRAAALGENRKFLIFDVEEIPEMKRGRGAMLQKYKQGGMADLRLFNATDGISWTSNGKTRTLSAKEFAPWQGARGSAGKTAPLGYPKTDPVLFR